MKPFFFYLVVLLHQKMFYARLLFEHTAGLFRNMMLFLEYQAFVCLFTVKVDAAQLIDSFMYGDVQSAYCSIFLWEPSVLMAGSEFYIMVVFCLEKYWHSVFKCTTF